MTLTVFSLASTSAIGILVSDMLRRTDNIVRDVSVWNELRGGLDICVFVCSAENGGRSVRRGEVGSYINREG